LRLKNGDALSPAALRAGRSGWLFLLLILFTGCGTTPTKPSPVAEQVDRVRQALVSITESYEKKDEKKFLAGFDPSFQSLPSYNERVQKELTTFSEISIDMKIDRVEVQAGSISTAVHWGGVWQGAPGIPPIEKKGHALFVWSTGETPFYWRFAAIPPLG
ncbi:MAG: hypothetical protein MPW15_12850, partial [Candidatus Manganitrophus sp.]|nr:hypothetical protein [Candidatus Manganitrophus sp.]